MALDKQVYLYSVDTACFYTDDEKILNDKLNRCYIIRKEIKEKDNICKEHQLKRINKYIPYYKTKLIKQFEDRDKTQLRELRDDSIKDSKIVSIFQSSLTRSINAKINEITQGIMIVRVFFF